MAWFLSAHFLLSPLALAGTQAAVCYPLTPKPIRGDLPWQPNSERHKASFAVGASVGCFGGSCKTAGRVIATFLRLLQWVPCIPADIQAFSLALKSVFLPDLVRNSRKPMLLDVFLWRLIPVISWASDGGWRNVLHLCSHLLTVCMLQALLYCSYNALLIILLIIFLTIYAALKTAFSIALKIFN